MGYLNEEQRLQTGYSYVIEKVQALSPFGKEMLKQIKPFDAKSEHLLIQELDEMELVISGMGSHPHEFKALGEPLPCFKDIRGSLKRCRNGSILDEVELYEIKCFSRLLQQTIDLYEATGLELPSICLTSMDDVWNLLDPEKTGVSTFYIYECYSEALGHIRKRKRSVEQEMLKATSHNKLDELRKKRLEAVIGEEGEELKVRTYLSEQIREKLLIFENNIYAIGRLDFLMAKCSVALDLNAIRPIIGSPDQLYIKDGFNPRVVDSLECCGKSFTPISIRLKSGMTVITGANMGGKSVTLKTVALNLMLFHTGFFVCAKEACLPMLDFIELISDDLQSLSQGLSTFGAEVLRLKELLALARKGTGFMGFDEFARGTNPKEGCYMAKALCKHLNTLPSVSLLTTHYDGVADENMVCYQVAGLKNTDFNELKKKLSLNHTNSIDIIQSHMDYRLERVTSAAKVPRDALNISMLIGLNDEIITIAKDFYEKGDCDNNG